MTSGWPACPRAASALAALVLVSAAIGCGQQPPSWDVLLAGKISGQYPNYTVTAVQPGLLKVERPGMPPRQVEVDPIAQHCLRGPRDCNYAVEQMLLVLRDP